jgi:hypothetical protein
MENYKSLCKLAPWLYRCLEEDALQPPQPFVTPVNERSKWTQKQNIGYLRSRDIPAVANMKAAEARCGVDELFCQPGGLPPAVIHSAAAVFPRDMRRLWLSCSTMFKDLMRVEHDAFSINRTNARVRAFLSEIEALDHLLQPSRSKPLYLAKYNFPSLLRAATHLAQFGNIRDLHRSKKQTTDRCDCVEVQSVVVTSIVNQQHAVRRQPRLYILSNPIAFIK